MKKQTFLQEIRKHGADRFPFNIYPCTIPRDFFTVPLHWHASMELIFVKKGTGIIQSGLTSNIANAGDIFLFAPGTLHALKRFEDHVMEYENIIFDLGGVMVDFDPKTYLVDRFCNAEVEEQVSQLTFESEEWKLLDAGLITRSEANLRMLARAKEYGRAFEVQGVLDDWMHILRPRRRMQELVRKLKSRGYCVYYLSNIPEDVLDFLTERDLKGLFDGGVASCEVHINKPDPRIYKALLDKYQLKAGESVFIDDRLENVQAAFRLGFAGIQMKDSVGTLVRSLATCSVAIH